MSNDTAKTITTNIVPVQGIFEPLPPYACINLVGPAGTPFYAPADPNLDGVTITNSTIDSTTIGATVPSTAAFTNATATDVPTGSYDLTNKLYVDAAIVGISWKQPVRAATTANITLSGAQTIDTVAVVAGDRVLVKNQSAQADNGIYIVGTPWTRSPDANTWDELVSAMVFVESGGQAGAAFYCPIQPGGTLGTTAITWSNFSVAGTYFAGTGLTLAANTFSITNTAVTPASYGSASAVPTFTVNAQGQLTAASNTNINIAATQIGSGTIDTARLSGSYSGITGLGTLGNLTVTNTISGSINGNAATATTATTATSATTATNLAGGGVGYLPYQSSAGATTFLAPGSNANVLTLAGGVPTWAAPATSGTVTSVGGTGTVSGISLSGTVTSSGNLTLGGALDLSSPPTIGNTIANTISGTTITATTKFVSPYFDAASSAGGALRNASGVAQLQWGASGGNNISLDVSTNLNGANAQIDISPTGTGRVNIKPTGSGSIEIAPTSLGTINNMSIGQTTAAAGSFTNLGVSGTISLAGSTGTAGYVLTSNGASAPTWQANANGVTISDDTTTNATRYLTFTSATTGNITTENVASTKLTFNPSTGALGAPAGVFNTINNTTLVNATVSSLSTPLATTYGGTGITTTPANGQIPIGNGTTYTAATITAGSGITVTNGAGSVTIAASGSGLPGTLGAIAYRGSAAGNSALVWNSTGNLTFTVPSGVTAVKVTCVGGGGNGGNAFQANTVAGGGGGGGVAIKYITGLTPGATVAVTVGAAGSSSSFGAYCTANGGSDGGVPTAGSGGSATGGDLNITGGSAGAGVSENCNYRGGSGGASGGASVVSNIVLLPGAASIIAGSGGVGRGGGANLSAATGYGNGGGGGASTSAPGSGGAGSPGIVIIEW